MAFTFRKEPPTTGLAGVGRPYPDTQVKRGGKVVGTISAPNWHTKDGKWGIGLVIVQEPTEADPCDFRWVFFKARFDSEPEARGWFRRNEAALLERYTLHEFEA